MDKDTLEDVKAQIWAQIGFYITQMDCPTEKRPTIMVRTLPAPNQFFKCQSCNQIFEVKTILEKVITK